MTTAMMAAAMPEAISAHSTAVASLSSRKNSRNFALIGPTHGRFLFSR
jgi:hypothetical protein